MSLKPTRQPLGYVVAMACGQVRCRMEVHPHVASIPVTSGKGMSLRCLRVGWSTPWSRMGEGCLPPHPPGKVVPQHVDTSWCPQAHYAEQGRAMFILPFSDPLLHSHCDWGQTARLESGHSPFSVGDLQPIGLPWCVEEGLLSLSGCWTPCRFCFPAPFGRAMCLLGAKGL